MVMSYPGRHPASSRRPATRRSSAGSVTAASSPGTPARRFEAKKRAQPPRGRRQVSASRPRAVRAPVGQGGAPPWWWPASSDRRRPPRGGPAGSASSSHPPASSAASAAAPRCRRTGASPSAAVESSHSPSYLVEMVLHRAPVAHRELASDQIDGLDAVGALVDRRDAGRPGSAGPRPVSSMKPMPPCTWRGRRWSARSPCRWPHALVSGVSNAARSSAAGPLGLIGAAGGPVDGLGVAVGEAAHGARR